MIFTEPHPLLGVISLWNYLFHNFMNYRISGIFAECGVVLKVANFRRTVLSVSSILSKNA